MRALRATLAVVLAAVPILALGCGDGEPTGYPTREWSGWFQSHMTDSSTDCWGADLPPPLKGFTMTVQHHLNNRADVRMGTFVSLSGAFEDDSLHATTSFDVPVALPDSIAARVTPEDSIDTVTYRLDAVFADSAYAGTYVVRTPDINALSRGESPGRCSYRYRIEGVEVEDLPTVGEDESPGVPGDDASPGVPDAPR